MISSHLKIVLIFLTFFLIQGCSTTPLTPSQTAQNFWAAVLAEDDDTASRYITKASTSTLESMPKEINNATVSFGEIRIKANHASIETSLQYDDERKSENTTFSTYLQQEEKNWRVDLIETNKSLQKSREKHGLNKLVDDLEKLGHDFSTQMDEMRKNWEEAQPEIKKELEALGKSVQDDVEGAIEKYGPEIEQNLQELTDSLDEALKELQKSLPQQGEPKNEKEEQPEGRLI
ncbi:hypothetical protein [Kaarinaea lacus]